MKSLYLNFVWGQSCQSVINVMSARQCKEMEAFQEFSAVSNFFTSPGSVPILITQRRLHVYCAHTPLSERDER